MNNTFLYFCLIAATFLSFYSCKTDHIKTEEIIILDTHEAIKVKKDLKLSDIAKSVEFVKLETNPDCLISSGLFVVGNKYIVFVNQRPGKVMLFDRSGKFIRKIGQVGQGPGEFKDPWYIDLSPNEDKILVESMGNPKKLLEFAIEGELIQTAEIPFASENGVQYLGNDQYVYMQSRYYTDSTDYPRVIVLDQDMQHPQALYSIDHKRNPSRMAGYFVRSLFSRVKGGVNFRDSMHDTVYFLDENLLPSPKFVIVEGDNTPPYYSMTIEESDAYKDNVDVLNEFGDYLLFMGKVKGNRAHMVYNKKTSDVFTLQKQSQCLGENSYSYGLLDDLTGNSPYWPWEALDLRNNSMQKLLSLVDLKDLVESDCFNDDMRLATTRYRDELKKLVESSSIEDNPIVQIFHLK